jgi:uncharacterized repeat protein (TIGR01451 family)
VVFQIETQTTSYTRDHSLADRDAYYWRVAVIDAWSNVGPYSPVRSFTKQGASVTLVSPISGTVITTTPIFRWEPVAGAARYEIQVAQNEQFSPIWDLGNVHNAFFAPTRVYDPLEHYWWHVRACDYNNRCGPWAEGKLRPTELTISKTGPGTAMEGSPITYTLTVDNHSGITVTNMVITDAIPMGASYVSGGTRVGDVVNWTVPSLYTSTQAIFVVTASTTITNDDYYVSADEGITAVGKEAVVTIITPLLRELAISKTGPSTALAGSLITYTLTVENRGEVAATNLVITDVIPAAANYVSGGILVGDAVNWTVPSLAETTSTQVSFVVTASTTITNDDYYVTADEGITAVGQDVVVTVIEAQPDYEYIYLPLVLRNNS